MNTEKKQRKHYVRTVAVFLVFAFSFLAVTGVLNSTNPPSVMDTRTYAVWESAPSWMWPLTLMWPSEQKPAKSLKLSSFTIPSPTPTPTRPPVLATLPASTPGVYPTLPPGSSIPLTTPAIGGPQPPSNYYCIDDVDPDMCDDNSSHLVPKGAGGVRGTCGSVIENTHRLVPVLPQYMKGLRDHLTTSVSTSCGSAGPASGYVSTHLVIDAFNLSGFAELSKTSHTSPTAMFSFFQSAPAGYTFIPYSIDVIQKYGNGQQDLTGCVMFLSAGSSYHIGIVNVLELYTSGGDGVLSILQSGTSMYIDRFPVSGWSVSVNSTNQTRTNGVVGFGCHT